MERAFFKLPVAMRPERAGVSGSSGCPFKRAMS
jgi:hypothetical protein